MQDTHAFVLTRVYIGHKTIRLARVISNAAGALLLCCPFVVSTFYWQLAGLSSLHAPFLSVSCFASWMELGDDFIFIGNPIVTVNSTRKSERPVHGEVHEQGLYVGLDLAVVVSFRNNSGESVFPFAVVERRGSYQTCFPYFLSFPIRCVRAETRNASH